jgi:hypothetical protein
MGAVDDDAALGDLGDVVDERDPAGAEVVYDVEVVNDLVVDVNGCALDVQDLIDDVDGHVDAGAESAGVSEEDFHACR